ncbi:enoyl-CoA hydratase/isomerase family protein [Aquamicrobium defluvii]|uniref:Enoyl-CoA hydratase n=1 Tax=Aquamicrobium defluvii TaxID=69279 RepID=A0A011UGE0_9HYPH|nr:enoyl-CoA hydratase/isomerase family protein [Aquamicrobium defluvii]EXL04923.1 enoyl-CoA hydratase [Aquamicrobium defluvii]EZQ14553.1 enoyl-CoA hydratase [Halopseudomonas bauzanensis]
MPGYETIKFIQDGPRATLSFNRPEVLNALNNQLIREVLDAVTKLPDSTRVLILRGEGGKAFAAGADLEEMRRRTPWSEIDFGPRRELARRLETAPFPTVAAIEGFALGGGLELALACHLRIAATSARLGLPESRLGILPANGGTARLARLVGRGTALRMIMLGEQIDATEARRLGIVDWLVEPAEFDAEVNKLADRLVTLAPIATRAIIDTVTRTTDMALDHAIDYEHRWFQLCLGSADKQEGVQAFLEKRPAKFGTRPSNIIFK